MCISNFFILIPIVPSLHQIHSFFFLLLQQPPKDSPDRFQKISDGNAAAGGVSNRRPVHNRCSAFGSDCERRIPTLPFSIRVDCMVLPSSQVLAALNLCAFSVLSVLELDSPRRSSGFVYPKSSCNLRTFATYSTARGRRKGERDREREEGDLQEL